ncbi:MAG: ribonuclease PH, partial [Actinomycetota bacterium]
AEVDMNVVVLGQPGGEPRFVEVQGTAEGAAFSQDELAQLLGLAKAGLREIFAMQTKLLATKPASRPQAK